jgi:hypothetical protein
MSATRTPPEPRALSREELEAAADVLDAVAQNRQLLASLPETERKRFLRAVSKVHNPDARALRRLAKATARQEKVARLKKDDRVLNETGIRALRAAARVHDAQRVSARRLRAAGRARGRDRARGRRAAALLRLQAEVRRRAPLLRPALSAVRGAQLPQAHRAGRSARTRGAAHRRTGQDRLPDRAEAAARRRAPHRHHPVPPQRRQPLRRRTRFRSMGPPPRSVRSRPASHAERRGVLPRAADHAAAARFHHQQRLSDRAPSARLLRAHDGAGDGGAGRHAGARPRSGRCLRRAARLSPAARGWRRGGQGARARPFRRVGARRVGAVVASGAAARGALGAAGSVPRGPARSGSAAGRTSAAAIRGGCCWPKCPPWSCSRCSWSTPWRRSSSTRASSR